MLDIRRGGTPPWRHILALLDQHIRQIDRTITELRQLRRTFTETRTHAAASAPADDAVCGIMERST